MSLFLHSDDNDDDAKAIATPQLCSKNSQAKNQNFLKLILIIKFSDSKTPAPLKEM